MGRNLDNKILFNPKICGIDEAGRGALAGPMAIAACVLKQEISGLNDSKKLTAKMREKLFNQITQSSNYLIIYFSSAQIDKMGLSECLRRALNIFKEHFKTQNLIYDGNLDYGTGIKTIIKADSKIAAVSAASIIAKVSRDNLMRAWDKIYPDYGYASHKGYGTLSHIKALKKYGQNELTRKSFHIKKCENSLF